LSTFAAPLDLGDQSRERLVVERFGFGRLE
jgi:hypothetical protein